MFATVLNATLIENPGFNLTYGRQFSQLFYNRTFNLNYTEFYIDAVGERINPLVVKDVDFQSRVFKPVMWQDAEQQKLKVITGTDFDWGGDRENRAPPNIPLCGYRSEFCNKKDNYQIIYGSSFGTTIALSGVAFVAILYWMRKRVALRQTDKTWWQLNFQLLDVGSASTLPMYTQTLNKLGAEGSRNTAILRGRAKYGNELVWADVIVPDCLYPDNQLPTNKATLEILRLLRPVSFNEHPNINRFLGVITLPAKKEILLLSNFCQRGSLHDLFQQFEHFDVDQCLPLAFDFLQGMRFIHESQLSFHGNLTGWNCLIDSRFTLKISRLGFDKLTKAFFGTSLLINLNAQDEEKLFWTAPEILRGERSASKQTDIFSIAVVLYEILTVSLPYKSTIAETRISDILNRICYGAPEPLRPITGNGESLRIPSAIRSVLCSCWLDVPFDRPTIHQIIQSFRATFKLNKRNEKSSLVDKLTKRLTVYAQTLEDEVALRTQALLTERLKCDNILAEILPRTILVDLRTGTPIMAELFESVTITFCDLYGFTYIATSLTPLEITKLLNTVYSLFDPVLANFDAYKVETVGSAYMVASGIPVRNGMQHVKEICAMTLSLRFQFLKTSFPTLELSFIAGIASGSCAAGIIGHKNLRYCLFGDTVNTASRMSSYSAPNKIHLSNTTADLLQRFPADFKIEERGILEIKGKGNQVTFWLERA